MQETHYSQLFFLSIIEQTLNCSKPFTGRCVLVKISTTLILKLSDIKFQAREIKHNNRDPRKRGTCYIKEPSHIGCREDSKK